MFLSHSCIHPQLRDLLVVANGQVIGASYQHLARYTLPKRRVSALERSSRKATEQALLRIRISF